MSTDAFVTYNRLRAPATLSSSATAEAKRLRLSQTSALIIATSTQAADPALAARPTPLHTFHDVRLLRPAGRDAALSDQDQFVGSKVDGEPIVSWLDLDRFEDWDLPELDAMRPDVRVKDEDSLFPIALAEDGETLPSGFHPSHPYGDLHDPLQSYTRKLKAWPINVDSLLPSDHEPAHDRRSQQNPDLLLVTSSMHHSPHDDGEIETGRAQPLSTKIRARQSVAPNVPHWPFKRYGPGAGGPNALHRNEMQRPWRPYRSTWADMGTDE